MLAMEDQAVDESELDLVAFLAETTGSDVSQMERLYRRTRDTFDFRGQAYRTLMLETVPASYSLVWCPATMTPR